MADRVVFDTNVRLSALLWRGAAYKCWLAARAGLVEVVYCREMLAEFSEKLYDKFGFSADNVRAAVYDFRRFGQQVEITGNLHVVASDADDDMFIECALVAGASMIVSGDHHLLDIEEYQETRIVTPRAFLEWLAKTA
jgi:putative PIN family toxin of toxin-antitoxin system